ncbi:MAG: DUF3300 domain-containing protein [Candidatus Acidiferrum sp.]|jgi:hypothetical protein
MKRIQCCMSFIMAFLLLSATSGIEGCGTKDSSPAAVVPQPPPNSSAQDPSAQQPQATQPAQPASADQSQPQPQAQPQTQLPPVDLTADGLDELLAPVALYPDPVLAVLLQAAVDPQQVMDGGNWLVLPENQNLKEAALDQASSKAGFTPVMQALLHYPTVVDLMCQQFDWTKQLGAAYQGNPKAVLDSVQRLRAQAVDNGALKSSPQMTVDVKQDQGKEVVELTPTDPKVVYVPQYDPSRVYSTTTTTTSPNGSTTTTTTSSAPAASSGSSTVVVQQQSSGVSTGTAVAIGLLSFGAGIAVGMAINRNNYYYPSWGYGGVYYGPRPYYPPPYRPVYYPGYGGGYHYNRPVHYGNNNIYINNNNYYNRFNNNNNLNPNYKPKPVPYNRNNPNSTYARSVGNNPGGNKGVNYRPPANNNANNFKGQGTYQGNRPANNGNANANTRPATGNIQNRPSGVNPGNNPNNAQRPAAGNNANNNWKGQTTYQGNKGANANAAANNRVATGNSPARNPSGDRGFGQTGGTRPTTNNTARPAPGNTPAASPATGNTNASRPAHNGAQPATRPAPQQANRQQPPASNGGAFGGVSNPKSDRAASNRGQASMGSSSKPTAAAGRKK